MEVALELVGPIPDLARIAGLKGKSPYRWRGASDWRDAGDMSPRANRALLRHSDAHGLGLTADHLIWGATRAEVARILRDRQSAQVAAQ